ncbi:MAG: PAS domain-containing protein [Deltaproteobacteria bacterium]|nr:PAS domain-containing protein [Deltaproteobacteria bacterium]
MKSERRHEESVFLFLLAILILLAVLPCVVISYIIYNLDRSRHIEQTAVLLNSLAADRELTTRLLIEKQRDALYFLSKDPNTVRLAGELAEKERPTNDSLEQMAKRSPFFIGLSAIDTETGRYRTAGTFPEEVMKRLAPEMKKNQGKSFVRTETLPSGERVLLIGQLIQESDKSEHGGVLLGLVRFAIFNDLFENTSMLGTTGESFLTDSDGVALTKLRYSSHKKMGHPINAKAMQDCLAGNSKEFVITQDYLDALTAMSYRPVQGFGGCVMVHMRESEVMAPISVLRRMIIAVVATMITAVALMAFLVVRKLLLMEKVRKQLEGDLAKHVSLMEATVAERTIELKNEIKGRIDAELKLRENEAFLENIVHNVHEVIFAVNVEADGGFRFMWCNANGERMIGAKSSDASGRTLVEVFGPEIGGRLAGHHSECIEKKAVIDYEEIFNAPNAQMVLLTTMVPVTDETGRVVQIISSSMDVTERKKLESDMIKSQKLESLGVLAGGIAHDFNNLLAVMRLNISMLKHSAVFDADSLEMIKLVDNSTAMATNLTNQLLTFAKGGKPVMKPFSVSEFLREVAQFSLSGTKTSCKLNLAAGLFDIEGDRGQMTQVINNMLINADQAMPQGGIVTLSAENIEVAGIDKGLPLKQGKYVKITIEDQGIGIPEENLSRIFDPYFTTKKEGSGLGLASSYSIIKNHNGHISVKSRGNNGAVFEIFVPALPKQASYESNDTDVLVKGSGRVLVMDDDDIVRSSVCKALKTLGYAAAAAANGQDAVLKYKEALENNKRFDAVILDLTVTTGMGGEEAVTKILQLDRSAKVFVSSGYSNNSVIANFKQYGFCGFLKKPYDALELERELLSCSTRT